MRLFKGILTAIGAVLAAAGAVGFFLPLILQSGFKGDNSIELPLASVEDVAVSSNGDVYFALMHAGRVQRYAGTGRFLGSFGVNGAGGVFCLDLRDDALHVQVARRDTTDVYALDGRLQRESVASDEGVKYFPCSGDPLVAEMTSTWSSMQVRFSDNRPALIIKRRPWHLLALHPFQSWFIFAVGLFLMSWWREGVLRALGFGGKKQ